MALSRMDQWKLKAAVTCFGLYAPWEQGLVCVADVSFLVHQGERLPHNMFLPKCSTTWLSSSSSSLPPFFQLKLHHHPRPYSLPSFSGWKAAGSRGAPSLWGLCVARGWPQSPRPDAAAFLLCWPTLAMISRRPPCCGAGGKDDGARECQAKGKGDGRPPLLFPLQQRRLGGALLG